MKAPDSEVVTVCDWLVPRLVTVTVAPGTTPPFESVTVPLMPPLFVCATTLSAQSRMAAINIIVRMSLFLSSASRN